VELVEPACVVIFNPCRVWRSKWQHDHPDGEKITMESKPSWMCSVPMFAALLLAAPFAQAAFPEHVVNNGLAPPNATNLMSDDSLYLAGYETIVVHNVNCTDALTPCPVWGAPTGYEIQAGAAFGDATPETYAIGVFGSSSMVMTGGVMTSTLNVLDDATLTISGGTITDSVWCAGNGTGDKARIFITGGTLEGPIQTVTDCEIEISGGTLLAGMRLWEWDETRVTITGGDIQGLIEGKEIVIVGSNFKLNGFPLSPGRMTGHSYDGTLTADLVNGGQINSPIGAGDGILLVDPNLAPGLALWGQIGLVLAIIGTLLIVQTGVEGRTRLG
jgi:hypothetical protein